MQSISDGGGYINRTQGGPSKAQPKPPADKPAADAPGYSVDIDFGNIAAQAPASKTHTAQAGSDVAPQTLAPTQAKAAVNHAPAILSMDQIQPTSFGRAENPGAIQGINSILDAGTKGFESMSGRIYSFQTV